MRRLNEMNATCLLKLARGIQSEGQKLWYQVMRGKYHHNNGWKTITAKPTDSHLWRSLVKLWPMLKDYDCWIVWDGMSIDFSHDAWISAGMRLSKCGLDIPVTCIHAKLVDIAIEGHWNWELLEDWLPVDILSKIRVMLSPHESYGADEKVCAENALGRFSIAEMYYAHYNFPTGEDEISWKHIWKVKVLERVRVFIWLIKHDRLLTNVRKHQMGLGVNTCEYCNGFLETVLHALRNCSLVNQFWTSVVPFAKRDRFFTSILWDWISLNIGSGRSQGWSEHWDRFWATTCHFLWMWRNKEKFDEGYV